MYDSTENARRARIDELNFELTMTKGTRRAELEAQYGQVWDTTQLSQDFTVIGFMAPFVVVEHKATGKKGSLEFCHSPRFYWGFQPDK